MAISEQIEAVLRAAKKRTAFAGAPSTTCIVRYPMSRPIFVSI
jgi:hypothetical protein